MTTLADKHQHNPPLYSLSFLRMQGKKVASKFYSDLRNASSLELTTYYCVSCSCSSSFTTWSTSEMVASVQLPLNSMFFCLVTWFWRQYCLHTQINRQHKDAKFWRGKIDCEGIFCFVSRALFLGTLGGRTMFQARSGQRTLFQSLQSTGSLVLLLYWQTGLTNWTHWEQKWGRKTLQSFAKIQKSASRLALQKLLQEINKILDLPVLCFWYVTGDESKAREWACHEIWSVDTESQNCQNCNTTTNC